MHEARLVDPDHRRARLDVAAMIARRREGVFENAIGLREARLDVADRRVAVTLNVRVRVHRALRKHERILFGMLVQDDRIRQQRRIGIEQPRQLLVFDVDRGDRGFGDLRRFGRHGGDELADEADAVDREHRPVTQAAAEVVVADVAAGEHGVNARHRARGRRVDRDDLRVGHRARRKSAHNIPGIRKSAVYLA